VTAAFFARVLEQHASRALDSAEDRRVVADALATATKEIAMTVTYEELPPVTRSAIDYWRRVLDLFPVSAQRTEADLDAFASTIAQHEAIRRSTPEPAPTLATDDPPASDAEALVRARRFLAKMHGAAFPLPGDGVFVEGDPAWSLTDARVAVHIERLDALADGCEHCQRERGQILDLRIALAQKEAHYAAAEEGT
jgi:hypothetical protein